jgi:hypothetical protein
MATSKRSSPQSLDPNAARDKELKSLKARCEEAEQEVGHLMSALARTERELAEARKQSARSLPPARRASVAMPAVSASLTPLVGATAEAMADVTASLIAVREVILTAARDIDAFARREFSIADGRSSKLYDVKASLLRAAGQKQPPKLPGGAVTPEVPATGSKKNSRSVAPPAMRRRTSVPPVALPAAPIRKLSAGTIDISELAEYLESLRPAAVEPEGDPFAAPPVVKMPASPKLPKIR